MTARRNLCPQIRWVIVDFPIPCHLIQVILYRLNFMVCFRWRNPLFIYLSVPVRLQENKYYSYQKSSGGAMSERWRGAHQYPRKLRVFTLLT